MGWTAPLWPLSQAYAPLFSPLGDFVSSAHKILTVDFCPIVSFDVAAQAHWGRPFKIDNPRTPATVWRQVLYCARSLELLP